MASEDKILKLQNKLLNEIEQERQTIEKNIDNLQKEAKKNHLRKRHPRPKKGGKND